MIAKPRRGFALIAALGVLAVLTILVFGAATRAHVTHTLTAADLAQHRLASALNAQARLLMTGADPGKPLAGDDDLTLTVQMLAEPPASPAVDLLGKREGDLFAEIQVSSRRLQGAGRRAIYLVNTKGQRSAPILIAESGTGGGKQTDRETRS
ncbi:MAG: hypothetical protein N2111_04855 [Candidatus Sumerlaeaceae bacterium]|nr:hypothetical protein [Candidatus Sumerlaeaceae bacterium]